MLRGLSLGDGKYFGDSEISHEFAITGSQPSKFALPFELSENSLLMSEDFVIVVTHPDLEENLSVPFICSVITQDDWLKAN